MPPKEIDIADVKSFEGQAIGVSPWHEVTQAEIDRFADATHDHQWIHVDVERAKKESPFGGPIAHGYYTLSIVPYLMDQTWLVTGKSAALNYGLNRLRYPAPVPVGCRVRLHVSVNSVENIPGGIQVVAGITIEVEGGRKPALSAEGVYRYYAA